MMVLLLNTSKKPPKSFYADHITSSSISFVHANLKKKKKYAELQCEFSFKSSYKRKANRYKQFFIHFYTRCHKVVSTLKQ